MLAGKARSLLGDRTKATIGAVYNVNHPGRRINRARRVPASRINRHVVPLRTFMLPKVEIRQEENERFDDELKDWQINEPLPPYHDHRFDIPQLMDRVKLGRRRNIPRRIRRDEFRTVNAAHGIDGKVAREKLLAHGESAFMTLQNATWQRDEWTKARHMEVRISDVPMDSPMPTHFMRVTTSESEELDNLLTPIHSTYIRGYWSRMNWLPEFNPMDICTPVNEKGELLPGDEYASGELPMVSVRVDNLHTMPHLVSYCYSQNAGGLVEQLVGNLATDFHQYVCKPLTVEQRKMEWEISQKLAAEFDTELVRIHSWFIYDLAQNGNCVGMDDDRFWWALDTALRIVMDTLVAQERFGWNPPPRPEEDNETQ